MGKAGWGLASLTAGLALVLAAGPVAAQVSGGAAGNGSTQGNGSTARALVTIIGELSYRERIALPPGSMLLVTLAEQGSGDPAAPALARQTIDLAGQQVPLRFRLTAVAAKLKAGVRYALRAVIQDAKGQPLWSIQSAHVVDPGQSLHNLGVLLLTRAAPPAAAAPETGPALRPPGTVYQCGERQVVALYEEDGLELALDGATLRLERGFSASGARYGGAMADGREVGFWSKGRNARLSIAGEAETACAQSEFAEDAQAGLYEARGRTPDWTLRIGPERLDLVRSGTVTSQIAQIAVPERQLLADGHRYVARLGEGELRVTINPGLCLDERTRTPFPDKVLVEAEDEVLTGCGGSASAFLAQGGDWKVTALNGQDIADTGLSMRFSGQGEVSGHAGCNRFTARYRADANGITIASRSAASTLMACPREVMLREQSLLSALRSIQRHTVEADGTLVLSGLDDTEIRLRR